MTFQWWVCVKHLFYRQETCFGGFHNSRGKLELISATVTVSCKILTKFAVVPVLYVQI